MRYVFIAEICLELVCRRSKNFKTVILSSRGYLSALLVGRCKQLITTYIHLIAAKTGGFRSDFILLYILIFLLLLLDFVMNHVPLEGVQSADRQILARSI